MVFCGEWSLVLYIVNAGLVAKYISYSLKIQIKDILPNIFIAASSFFLLYLGRMYWEFHFSLYILLYLTCYLLQAYVFKLEALKDIVNILQNLHIKK